MNTKVGPKVVRIRDELTVADNKNKDLNNSNLTASMDLHNVLQRCSPTNHVLTNICSLFIGQQFRH
jgi:hypothetical protein